jgi:periplasmic divalent cation tolerance protein
VTDRVVIVLSTCPDATVARRIAEALVTERLATCVNRVAGIQSTYFWDGRLQDDAEILLLMKTTRERLPELKQRVQALHPYELAELLAIEVSDGAERYLDWVRAGVERVSG